MRRRQGPRQPFGCPRPGAASVGAARRNWEAYQSSWSCIHLQCSPRGDGPLRGEFQMIDAGSDDFLMDHETLSAGQSGKHAWCSVRPTDTPTISLKSRASRRILPVVRIVDMAMAVPHPVFSGGSRQMILRSSVLAPAANRCLRDGEQWASPAARHWQRK